VLGAGEGGGVCAGAGALGFASGAGACVAVVTLGVVVALRLGSGKLSSGELRIIATMTMTTAIAAYASRRPPSPMRDHRLSRGCCALLGTTVPSVLPFRTRTCSPSAGCRGRRHRRAGGRASVHRPPVPLGALRAPARLPH
jgi:hypothetical protein